VLADYDPADVLARILEDIESGDSPGARTIEEKIVRRVCKTAAVKAGQVLSYDEMQGLLRQLERCQTPLTCPHGRPTMIHMSNMDLAKEFGRT
jgi:DNA mismatch repair protein MutL